MLLSGYLELSVSSLNFSPVASLLADEFQLKVGPKRPEGVETFHMMLRLAPARVSRLVVPNLVSRRRRWRLIRGKLHGTRMHTRRAPIGLSSETSKRLKRMGKKKGSSKTERLTGCTNGNNYVVSTYLSLGVIVFRRLLWWARLVLRAI